MIDSVIVCFLFFFGWLLVGLLTLMAG